jgi:hypothetical protein
MRREWRSASCNSQQNEKNRSSDHIGQTLEGPYGFPASFPALPLPPANP